MTLRRWASVLALGLSLAGCTKHNASRVSVLPPPETSTTLGPGDVFAVAVLGEKDLPLEYRVQPDGTVDFPYVKRVKVSGLEPQEVVDLLRKRLVEERIYSDPQLSLLIKQYNSKKVNVLGQVAKPGTLSWSDGMRLVEAISQAGGFTAIADRDNVVLMRTDRVGRVVTVSLSVDEITEGREPNPMLQAGDTVRVDQRAF
jgi:protein involved in polysaccharide export with SLBB domain